MNKLMLAYLEILRPGNCAMTGFAVFIGGLLAAGGLGILDNPGIYLAMLAAFLIAGAGNVINDWRDFDIDAVNKPGRPIPSGRIKRRHAFAYAVVLFLLGLALAGMVNTLAMAIALLNSVVLALYAVALQGRLLVGNASISYLVGSSFLFGGAVMGNLLLPGLLFLLAFFANLAREIVKDLEDLAGDRKGLAKLAQQASKLRAKVEQMLGIGKGKSLALRFGEPLARAAAAVTLLIAIGLSPLPYLLGTLSFSYLLAVLPADAAFLSVIYGLAQGDKKYGKLSKRIKLAMLLGMLAFVAGILIRL